MCVTFTRGLSAEEVFARYGADPSEAAVLDWEAAASDLPAGDPRDGTAALLRAGRIGEWAFCVEEEGGLGFGEESLAELSRGTETYSVATTEGIDVFQYWRDGECVEYFEPGMEYTRSEPFGPWWDQVQAVLVAHEGGDAGMAPVVARSRPPRYHPGRRHPRDALAQPDTYRGRRTAADTGRHLRGRGTSPARLCHTVTDADAAELIRGDSPIPTRPRLSPRSCGTWTDEPPLSAVAPPTKPGPFRWPRSLPATRPSPGVAGVVAARRSGVWTCWSIFGCLTC
ncbi:DUF6461 domain-containing protein [Streptomyces sp. NPDC006516]|uniref:DUF6461 domain-containing protein n=1 Tax=Streptomyces sp. NPDC006516 TaxID=3154309 RepID=UPI0033B8F77F